MRKNIWINGTDRTEITTEYGYSVLYVKRTGGNGGTVLSGKIIEDVLANKAKITVPLLPLREEQYRELLRDIYSGTYAEVMFFDPKADGDGYRIAEFIYDEISAQHIMESIDGNDYWIVPPLVFEER